ncbi:MAG: ComEA family DNA-binding protein [Planctomycetota bacterium]
MALTVRALAAALDGGMRPRVPRLVAIQIDLNRASLAELGVLPGVGSERAAAIVLHRVRRGPFRSVEELAEVDGFGPVLLGALRPHLCATPLGPR